MPIPHEPGEETPHRTMIIGIGTDLLDIRRIERTLKRFGERFVARIFTETERARAYGRVNPAALGPALATVNV